MLELQLKQLPIPFSVRLTLTVTRVKDDTSLSLVGYLERAVLGVVWVVEDVSQILDAHR